MGGIPGFSRSEKGGWGLGVPGQANAVYRLAQGRRKKIKVDVSYSPTFRLHISMKMLYDFGKYFLISVTPDLFVTLASYISANASQPTL